MVSPCIMCNVALPLSVTAVPLAVIPALPGCLAKQVRSRQTSQEHRSVDITKFSICVSGFPRADASTELRCEEEDVGLEGSLQDGCKIAAVSSEFGASKVRSKSGIASLQWCHAKTRERLITNWCSSRKQNGHSETIPQ